MDTHLVLISGGGFSTEENSYIDNFALNLCSTTKNKKNIFFIPTASHDSENYIKKFKEAFKNHNTYHLTKEELMNNSSLNKADLIYIGGGDTNYLLDIWRSKGFDKKIIELYKNGTVIVGISAGAVCWFTHVHENNKLGLGLDVLKGSLCPHYDEIDDYQISYENWAKKNPQVKHYKLNNNESLHVKNNQIVAKIIS